MADEGEELQDDFFSSQSESVKVEPKQSLFFDDDDDEDDDVKKSEIKVEEASQVSAAPSSSAKRCNSHQDEKPVKRPRKNSEDDAFPYAATNTQPKMEAHWDRRFVGTFIVQAWSLSKGSNYVQQGDKIFVQRQKPKVAGQSLNNGKSASKSNGTVKSKQTRLVFNTAAATPKKAKVKEDYVVRFSNSRGN